MNHCFFTSIDQLTARQLSYLAAERSESGRRTETESEASYRERLTSGGEAGGRQAGDRFAVPGSDLAERHAATCETAAWFDSERNEERKRSVKEN